MVVEKFLKFIFVVGFSKKNKDKINMLSEAKLGIHGSHKYVQTHLNHL
jgi:hypothetical protein